MGQNLKNIQKPVIFTATIGIGLLSLVLWSYYSPVRDILDLRVKRPIEFHLRDLLGKNPRIDKKLKIFAFDDNTFARLKRPRLYVREWEKILTALEAKKVDSILIDMLFSTFPEEEGALTAVRKIAQIKTPITVGAFLASRKIKKRYEIDSERNDFSLNFSKEKSRRIFDPGEIPKLESREGHYVYGPAEEFMEAFKHVGHINYKGAFTIFPAFQFQTNRFLPHMSLLTRDFYFEKGELIANGHRVHMDSDGKAVVNVSPPINYYRQTKGITSLLRPALAGKTIKSVEKGDVVFIIPGMYTGSTDFKSSPFGVIPGGIIQAAAINSVLTGQWLRYAPFEWVYILGFGLLGTLLGRSHSVRKFWLFLVLGTLSVCSVGLVLFVYASLLTPWLFSAISFVMIAMVVHAKNSHYLEKKALEHEILKIKQESLEKEMAMASKIALAFLPDPVPTWANIAIGSYHKTFMDASGDWFAYASSQDNKLNHFILCDIAGHGMQAALVVSSCKTTMSLIKNQGRSLEQKDFIISFKDLLNEVLYTHGRGGHVTTFLGITFAPDQNEVYLLACGHPPPYYVHNSDDSKTIRKIRTKSNLIGTGSDHSGALVVHPFMPGDKLIAYTDGIPARTLSKVVTSLEREPGEIPDHHAERTIKEIWRLEVLKKNNIPDDDQSLIIFEHLS